MSNIIIFSKAISYQSNSGEHATRPLKASSAVPNSLFLSLLPPLVAQNPPPRTRHGDNLAAKITRETGVSLLPGALSKRANARHPFHHVRGVHQSHPQPAYGRHDAPAPRDHETASCHPLAPSPRRYSLGAPAGGHRHVESRPRHQGQGVRGGEYKGRRSRPPRSGSPSPLSTTRSLVRCQAGVSVVHSPSASFVRPSNTLSLDSRPHAWPFTLRPSLLHSRTYRAASTWISVSHPQPSFS